MKSAWLLLVAIPGIAWLTAIAHRNKARDLALEAYQEGRYSEAVAQLHLLRDSLEFDDSAGYAQLAIANIYYQQGMATVDSLVRIMQHQDSASLEELQWVEQRSQEIQANFDQGITGGLLPLDSASEAYTMVQGAINPRAVGEAYQQAGLMTARFKGEQEYEAALEQFKQALMADPTNEEARHNYEMLKKYLLQKEEEQTGETPPPPEPSEYAKQLKEQADRLAAQQKYTEALELMIEGAKQDPTVQAYQGFMERLRAIVEIESPNS